MSNLEAAAKVLRAEIETGIECDADWLTIAEKVLEAGCARDNQLREAARALRQACRDANGPVVPTPVAEAIARVTALGEEKTR